MLQEALQHQVTVFSSSENNCMFQAKRCLDDSLTVVHDGACEDSVLTKRADCADLGCIALYDPVCGTDGVTYGAVLYKHCLCGTDNIIKKFFYVDDLIL